jgi:hypothetical protein
MLGRDILNSNALRPDPAANMAPQPGVATEDAAALDRARKLELWKAQKAAAAAEKVRPRPEAALLRACPAGWSGRGVCGAADSPGRARAGASRRRASVDSVHFVILAEPIGLPRAARRRWSTCGAVGRARPCADPRLAAPRRRRRPRGARD